VVFSYRSITAMAEIDKPGSFYLGRPHDISKKKTGAEPLLYDSKDLTTHAVCVGMTGSGKTGLCLALLEEAGLAITPFEIKPQKGDVEADEVSLVWLPYRISPAGAVEPVYEIPNS
jgi:hypothetical protein